MLLARRTNQAPSQVYLDEMRPLPITKVSSTRNQMPDIDPRNTMLQSGKIEEALAANQQGRLVVWR
jgi:hypothetical protein